MKIVWMTIIFAVAMLLPSTVFAHSYVSESKPAADEVVSEAVEGLELFFNGGIEQFSTVTVLNENEEEVEIRDIIIDSPTMIVEFDQELPPGQYTVNWMAIGADTHQTEGAYSFTVDESVRQIENEKNEQEEIAEDQQVEEMTEEVVEDESMNEDGSENEEATSFSIIHIILLLGLLSVILYAVVWFTKRRKQ
ncbi:copper resistance CopC family protein [Bacillus sp. FJAT-45037]|uniref:copper resistance CopC family protein n=1 Tax=Bacillus sp. FJAT-45037 TaxID=2011007 RepID=UPI0012FD3015|nr:copper resistance protein CopC [Bacillus sp. FJAT-45037]